MVMPQARGVVAQIDVAIAGAGSPSKMYQNSSLPISTSTDGEELRHRRVQARHHHVEIVHLAGVRDHRHREDSASACTLRAWVMPPTRLVSNWM